MILHSMSFDQFDRVLKALNIFCNVRWQMFQIHRNKTRLALEKFQVFNIKNAHQVEMWIDLIFHDLFYNRKIRIFWILTDKIKSINKLIFNKKFQTYTDSPCRLGKDCDCISNVNWKTRFEENWLITFFSIHYYYHRQLITIFCWNQSIE